MEVLRARARELVKRAGVGDVAPSALAVGAAVALVVVCAALWQWWPSRGDSGAVVATSAARAAAGQSAEPAESPGSLPSAASGNVVAGAEPTSSQADLLVHVVGAVRRPGVYRLSPGARVTDAVEAAGGLIGSAAQASVNLARPLSDGEQVYVPTQDEAANGIGSVGGAAGVSSGAGAGATGGAGSSGAPSGPVNINTADAALLDTLPGVGPSTAAKIVAEREANGPFSSADDLARVSGIGPKKLEDLKGLVVTR